MELDIDRLRGLCSLSNSNQEKYIQNSKSISNITVNKPRINAPGTNINIIETEENSGTRRLCEIEQHEMSLYYNKLCEK